MISRLTIFIAGLSIMLSISACAQIQSNTSADSGDSQPTPKSSIAPHTVNVRAQILSINKESDQKWVAEARVQRVLEYGQGTPVLTPSQEITIHIPVSNRDEDELPDIKSGDRIQWNIKFQAQETLGATQSGEWHLRLVLTP